MNATDDGDKLEIPSSSGHTLMHLRRTQHAGGNTKECEVDTLEGTQENKDIYHNAESIEEKPWRRAGANISDYFNYGFDEESWKAYCRKQRKLQAVKNKLHAKIMAQMGHTGYGEEGSHTYSFPGSPSRLAFRKSDPTTDLIGGQPESSREDGHQSLSKRGHNTEVVTEMCHNKDSITAYRLPPPVSMNSGFSLITSPSFHFHSGPTPPSLTTILDSGHSKGFDTLSPLLYRSSSGRITTCPGVIDAAKSWDCYILQEKRDKDRDRARQHHHDKESRRGRYREKENCSSLRDRWQRTKEPHLLKTSGKEKNREEQMKHRYTRKRGKKHRSFKRGSGEEEERKEKKRDKNKGSQRTERGSKRNRDDGEDRDTRRKHRKAKRSRKYEEGGKMFSADQKRKLKFD